MALSSSSPPFPCYFELIPSWVDFKVSSIWDSSAVSMATESRVLFRLGSQAAVSFLPSLPPSLTRPPPHAQQQCQPHTECNLPPLQALPRAQQASPSPGKRSGVMQVKQKGKSYPSHSPPQKDPVKQALLGLQQGRHHRDATNLTTTLNAT